MATILFGGGDGGGIIIGPNGIRRIPPFDPPIQRQLKALNGMIRVSGIDRALDRELDQVTLKLTQNVLSSLEKTTGPVSNQNPVVFVDADDGFVCGSTGKPPIPFPHRLMSFQLGQAAELEAVAK